MKGAAAESSDVCAFARVLVSIATRHGGAVLATAAVVTALLGHEYARMTFTNDPSVITLEGSPALARYREFVSRWGSDELIVLAYETDDAFARAELLRVRWLTERLYEIDGVRDVYSLDTAFTIDTGPLGTFPRPLLPDDLSLVAEPGALREAALASDFIRDAIVSHDGKMLVLAVQLDGDDLDNTALARRVLASIDGLLQAVELADVSVLLAGSPVFGRALAELNQRDSALFTPIVVAVLAMLLAVLFRSVLPPLLALVVVGTSLVWTLGGMSALGIPMNLTTSLLPPLLLVIAVANAVHIIAGYQDRLRGGDAREQALAWTVREVVPSCLATSATTAIGFASLWLVQIESVRTFGAFAAVGVGVALLHSIVLLPALLVRVPLERSAARWKAAFGLGLCARAARRPALAAGLMMVAMAVAAIGMPRIEVATHDGEFFSDSHPINTAYRTMEARLGAVTPFEIEIASDRSLFTGESVRAMAALQHGIAALPELSRGTSLPDLLRQAAPGIDLADDCAIKRALFTLQAMAPGEVERFLRSDPPRARISARAQSMTSERSLAIAREIGALAQRIAPEDWDVHVTGIVSIFAQMEQSLVEGQLRSYAGALAAITLVFLAVFRSVPIVIAALAVNLAPIGMAGGLMGLWGIRLDVGTIMVASVALGIIVDDTIHLIRSYQRNRARFASPAEALDRALEVAGRPIVLTSLILIGGFATLLSSGFTPTAHFGALVCIAVGGALIADLLVLPAALLLIAARPAAVRLLPRQEVTS